MRWLTEHLDYHPSLGVGLGFVLGIIMSQVIKGL